MTRVALTLALLAVLALSACGGSGEQAPGPIGNNRSESQGTSEYIVPSRDKISNAGSPSAAQHPQGEKDDEVSETGASEENPCELVSKDQASTILGEGVQTSVGAQGPTCIYIPKGAKPQMTVAIEQTSFQSLRGHASKATRMAVGNVTGWCLDYGSTSVAIELEEGRVLRVTGPCSVGARFAARALDRVPPS
jgi:hypothetical protein